MTSIATVLDLPTMFIYVVDNLIRFGYENSQLKKKLFNNKVGLLRNQQVHNKLIYLLTCIQNNIFTASNRFSNIKNILTYFYFRQCTHQRVYYWTDINETYTNIYSNSRAHYESEAPISAAKK